MKRTKDRIPQLKTLERMIVEAMKRNNEPNEQLRRIYDDVYRHFSDVQYLHSENHKAILECIYKKDYYKYHNVQALVMEFHLDNKKLLRMREDYLQLFTKYYFSLEDTPNDYRVLLYEALKNTRRITRRKQR